MESKEIERDLGKVEGKLDLIVGLISQLRADITSDLNNKETKIETLHSRVNKIENKLYWFTGAAVVFVFVVGKIDFSKLFSVAAVASQ